MQKKAKNGKKAHQTAIDIANRIDHSLSDNSPICQLLASDPSFHNTISLISSSPYDECPPLIYIIKVIADKILHLFLTAYKIMMSLKQIAWLRWPGEITMRMVLLTTNWTLHAWVRINKDRRYSVTKQQT